MKKEKHRRGMSKEEKMGWVVASIVFVMTFIFYFVYGFLSNCVFEWPIRWDIGACWHEQINPAKNKATESAVKFIP